MDNKLIVNYELNNCFLQWDKEHQNREQILLVVSSQGYQANVYLWENKMGICFTSRASVGYGGIGKTKEGDGKTPIGLYEVDHAFGIHEKIKTNLNYEKITNKDYWIDDLKSPYYNQKIYSEKTPKCSSEHLIEYKKEYEYGLSLDYNLYGTKPIGSAIFIHCENKKLNYTNGCIALPRRKMKKLLEKIKKDVVVLII